MLRINIVVAFVVGLSSFVYTQDTPQTSKDSVVIKKERKRYHIIADSMYKERLKQEKINGNYIPRDLLDAFRELDKIIVGAARENFMNFSDEEVDKRTHRKIGFILKERWYMYEGSRYTGFFKRMGINGLEHMIGITIQSYHRHLHKKDLQVREQIDFFKKLAKQKKK